MIQLIQETFFAPMNEGMFEAFIFLYGIAVIAGSWLMLKGISEAPMGYEDEYGFHYARVSHIEESVFETTDR